MSIRDEILDSPYGAQIRLVRAAGFTRQTLYQLLHKRTGSRKAAKAFARAYGAPARWPEFFDDEPVSVHEPPPSDPPEAA